MGFAMKVARGVSIFLLVFLSMGSFVGSVPMIIDPAGNQFGFMPVSLLRYSPFRSFLIPGLLLLTANGLLPLYVLRQLQKRRPWFGLWVALQGCVLFGFEVTECLMLRMLIWPHYLYMSIAIALIVCGVFLQQIANRRGPVTADTRPETQ